MSLVTELDKIIIMVLVMLISPLNIGSNNIIDLIFFFCHFGRNFSNIYDSHQGGIERGCRQAEGHDTFSYEHNISSHNQTDFWFCLSQCIVYRCIISVIDIVVCINNITTPIPVSGRGEWPGGPFLVWM